MFEGFKIAVDGPVLTLTHGDYYSETLIRSETFRAGCVKGLVLDDVSVTISFPFRTLRLGPTDENAGIDVQWIEQVGATVFADVPGDYAAKLSALHEALTGLL